MHRILHDLHAIEDAAGEEENGKVEHSKDLIPHKEASGLKKSEGRPSFFFGLFLRVLVVFFWKRSLRLESSYFKRRFGGFGGFWWVGMFNLLNK